ncbi:Hsp20/alpha crystallin family protein [Streptomyces roseoviridis]|uniref:Hsp20/alpha crystallin family protein n=1 Tax=Streptomyces roseoviridis TaxID=67361 RepID=A0ABV5QUD4_9ACTN
MTATTERLLDRPPPPAEPHPSDWATAGYPVLDEISAADGVHVEERLADGRYVLQAELPGIDAEDIEVTITQGRLILRAGRSDESTRPGRAEFRYGYFTPLPPGVMSDEATAAYEQGVLTITMPVLEVKDGLRAVSVRHL